MVCLLGVARNFEWILGTNHCTSLVLPDIGVERVSAGLDDLFVEHSGFFEDGVCGFAGIVFHADRQILETLVEFLRLGLTPGKQSKPTGVDSAIHMVGVLRAAVERNGRGHARSNDHLGNVLLRDTIKDSRVADPRSSDRPRSNISVTKKEPCVRDSEKQQCKDEEGPTQRIHSQEGRSFEEDGDGDGTGHVISESLAASGGKPLPCGSVEEVSYSY